MDLEKLEVWKFGKISGGSGKLSKVAQSFGRVAVFGGCCGVRGWGAWVLWSCKATVVHLLMNSSEQLYGRPSCSLLYVF